MYGFCHTNGIGGSIAHIGHYRTVFADVLYAHCRGNITAMGRHYGVKFPVVYIEGAACHVHNGNQLVLYFQLLCHLSDKAAGQSVAAARAEAR